MKIHTSVSFRALDAQMLIQQEFISTIDEVPCHTSIANWILKIGYYELTRVKVKTSDWIVFLDHSIQIGAEKVLVVYGIRRGEIPLDRALRYNDLTTMAIVSRTKWSGADVAEEIEKLKGELGKILYAVGDYGANLRKGLQLCEIPHIHDLTHWMANAVEKLYQNDEQYKSFCLKMSELRKKFIQSDIAHIMPPKQRKKSFYQNIKSISDWAMKSLRFLESESESSQEYVKEKENLQWLVEYKDFIGELDRLNQTICAIEKILKTKGLSLETIKTCNSILNLSQINNTEKGAKLKVQILDYMKQTLQLVPQEECLLCTSDILESAFGKYKNFVSSNPMACVTNSILSLAAFTSSLTESEIVKALEQTKIKDIKMWTNENLGDSVLKKRTTMLSAS